jgi:nitrous oxide reductase accessory protein NosL
VKKVYVCYKWEGFPGEMCKETQIVLRHRIDAENWVKEHGGKGSVGYDEVEFSG